MLAPSPTTSLPKSLLRDPPPSLRLRAQAELELRRRRKARLLEQYRTDPLALPSALGITPDPWQEQVLADQHQTILLNCGRQVGKTEVLAALLVRALLEPDSLNLILSPTERQSREVYRRVLALWRRLQRPIPYRVANLTSLELENNSRLVALPGNPQTIRGLAAVRTLVIDESGYVPDPVAQAVFPMLAVSGGRLITASTAAGRRGWWYDLIQNQDQDPDSLYLEVPSTRCPRISPAFLEREQRRIGDWWFAQEYLCAFQEAQTAAFPSWAIDQAQRDDVSYDADLFAP